MQPHSVWKIGVNAMAGYEELSDNALVARSNQGDAAAMKALYYRHREWVFGQALRYCENEDDAADVMQEVFSYFFCKFPGFELTSKLQTFLFPAIRNISLNLLRRKRRVVPIDSNQIERIPNGNGLPSAGVQFYSYIETLNEEEQEILLLRFADDKSLKEIGKELSIPLGTVKSRLHRALSHLREVLKTNGIHQKNT